MPAPTPTPPLRYVSHRRLTSPLASATSEATRSTIGHGGPLDESQFAATTARKRYAHTLSSSEGHPDRFREEHGEESALHKTHTEEIMRASATAHSSDVNWYGRAGASPTSPPLLPSSLPPSGSFSGGGGGGGDAALHANNPLHRPRASALRDGVATTPHVPPSSAEDLQATLHALRHENAILRQRIGVLTSADAAEETPLPSPSPEVPREVLLKRIARLEAALRLEALERDVVEQRLLAQERVLRAVCTPVPPPAPAASAE